ncbi:hypothetical protein AYO49_03130 [Verrucomicrobiaceae bacterium SCGC AG-212-N21]|nr:hypothetical protein AYO49_03130 [Verrucomicrobiaceae bacterium SCGC AG-212-N21]
MNSQSFPISSNGRDHHVTESLRSLLIAAMHYAEARIKLFWLECHEVMDRGIAVLAVALAAVLSVIITYVGSMIALVFWIARTWWESDPLPAVIMVTLGHLLLAVASIAWVIRASKGAHFFHATLKEFKEDKQWLHTSQTSRN